MCGLAITSFRDESSRRFILSHSGRQGAVCKAEGRLLTVRGALGGYRDGSSDSAGTMRSSVVECKPLYHGMMDGAKGREQGLMSNSGGLPLALVTAVQRWDDTQTK